MGQLRDLKDLMIHELKDIYSAETQIIDALPKMAEKASNEELRNALNHHLEETKRQKERLDEISRELDTSLSGSSCEAIKGMVRESERLFNEDAAPNVRDAGIIAEAQKVEHYEISAYGTTHYYAQELGLNNVARLLAETLDEERNADSKLNEVAKTKINPQAEKQVH
jgi:ferritin-like metal-binding protein YciE